MGHWRTLAIGTMAAVATGALAFSGTPSASATPICFVGELDPLEYLVCSPSHTHSENTPAPGVTETFDGQRLYTAALFVHQGGDPVAVQMVQYGTGGQSDHTQTAPDSAMHEWGTDVRELALVAVDTPAGPAIGLADVSVAQQGWRSTGSASGDHDAQTTSAGGFAYLQVGDTAAVIAAGASQDAADGSCTTVVFTTVSSTPLPCPAEVPMLPQLPAIDVPI
jgi:hypothetical protein